ncbi:MAG: pyridoxal-phosphate dependent enzyme [Bernardetiaceae bacterium]|nr:pyridoxal-phosphate dependent enzyme [Bernardetiaceae bacterium]
MATLPVADWQPPPLHPLPHPVATRQGVELYTLRLDLVHPHLQGNKWYKLRPNLAAAEAQGHRTLLTFGGAFSNHLYSTAAAGSLLGWRTVGLVRGEPTQPLNPVLTFAQACGMELHYLSRGQYRHKTEPGFLAEIAQTYGPAYLLPEGGSNALAVTGCAQMLAELPPELSFDYYACALGTGCTLAGLLLAVAARRQAKAQVLGFPVLKGGGFLAAETTRLLAEHAQVRGFPTPPLPAWQLLVNYHFGGYAKVPPALAQWVTEFNHWAVAHGPAPACVLEPVYTGKLFYGVLDLIGEGGIAPGSRVLVLHTGGVYANASVQY